MAATAAARRSYGTGALFEKAGSAGRVSWYGKWRHHGTQVKRRIGLKRREGTRDGLTRRAPEAELRRLIAEARDPGVRGADHRRDWSPLHDSPGADGPQAFDAHCGGVCACVHLEPFFGERAISSITHEDVVDLLALLEKKGVGPKSIRNYIGTLSAIFNFAKGPRRRWATWNPCDGLELPAVPDHEGFRYRDLDQMDALVSSAAAGAYHKLDEVLYRTAAMMGLRLGELVAIRWRDVDWTASAIRVRSNYVLGEFGAPKSRRSSRSVPMADEVGGALDRHFKACGEPGDSELAFADPLRGGPLDKAAVLRRMRNALRAAKLNEAHPFHDLRHTFGTAMAGARVPMRTLQEWMGHRDIEITRRYADYAPHAREAELVAAAFSRENAPMPSSSVAEVASQG